MSPEDIRAMVLADENFKALAVSGCDGQLAAELSVAQPAVPKPSTFLGEMGIVALLGTEAGVVFLAGLEAVADGNSPVAMLMKRVVKHVNSERGVDVGHPVTQANLLALASEGAISQASADAVIAHGSHRPPVTADEVSAALAIYRPEGKVGTPIEG